MPANTKAGINGMKPNFRLCRADYFHMSMTIAE
jgi:hypothetical protein